MPSQLSERETQIVRLATEVMKWKLLPDRSGSGVTMFWRPDACNIATWKNAQGGDGRSWNPFESIADAFMLVERLVSQHMAYTLNGPAANHPSQPTATGHIANFSEWNLPRHSGAWGQTAPIAICLAALMTLEGK